MSDIFNDTRKVIKLRTPAVNAATKIDLHIKNFIPQELNNKAKEECKPCQKRETS